MSFALANAQRAATHALILKDQRDARGRYYNPNSLGLMLGRKQEAEEETAKKLGARKFEDVWARDDDHAIETYKHAIASYMGDEPGFVGGPMIKAINRAREKVTKHARTR